MVEPSEIIALDPPARRGVRAWHLLAMMLASALAVGGLYSMGRDQRAGAVVLALMLLGVLAAVIVVVGSLAVGLMLGGFVAGGLNGWGVGRGPWNRRIWGALAVLAWLGLGLGGIILGLAIAVAGFTQVYSYFLE